MNQDTSLAMICVLLLVFAGQTPADSLNYQYEGDVLPYDPSAGWTIFNPCEPPCSEASESGHYVLAWSEASDPVNFDLEIADPPIKPPTSLWVEWRFRSNHALGGIFTGCDAFFVVHFRQIFDVIEMYGDAAIPFSGSSAITGLENNAFHLYRFESNDGSTFLFSVNGLVFYDAIGNRGSGFNNLQFGGLGGCLGDQFPNMINEWDFVRYGEIGFGELVAQTEPAMGWLDPQEHASLNRFAVTFDAPNYIYLDDITVEVTPAPGQSSTIEPPIPTKTWRRENDGPETLEIVLDRSLPINAHTRFVFQDAGCRDSDPETECSVNTVDYSFIPGDASANGHIDLADYAVLQNCFDQTSSLGMCRAVELAGSNTIDLLDHAEFVSLLVTP